VNIYVLAFVVAATAGAVACAVCLRTGWIGCLLVALAPLAFILAFGLIAAPLLVPPAPGECDPCGLGAIVFVVLSAAATFGIWVGVGFAVAARRRRALND
jgi:hypothetical protein